MFDHIIKYKLPLITFSIFASLFCTLEIKKKINQIFLLFLLNTSIILHKIISQVYFTKNHQFFISILLKVLIKYKFIFTYLMFMGLDLKILKITFKSK